MSEPAPTPAVAADAAAPRSKRDRASDIVRSNLAWSAAAGVLPLPLFDLIAITGVQLKMVAEISAVYKVPFSEHAARSVILSLLGTLGGGAVATAFVASAFKFIPVAGPLAAWTTLPIAASAVTHSVGHVFIEHFERGGTILDLDAARLKHFFKEEYSKVVRSASEVRDSLKPEVAPASSPASTPTPAAPAVP
jgi:uncharacterized protein (DUF697 family)